MSVKELEKIILESDLCEAAFYGRGCCQDVANLATAIHDAGFRKSEIDGETSDGYHTFNELYEHRVILWINLILLQPSEICYLVEDHYEGWFLLGIETITHFHRHFSKLSAQE